MAFPILGIPRPHFIDSSGNPLASGTVTIQNPSDSAVKKSYPTAADADADTNGTSADVSLNARGQPNQDLWGRDNEDYKIIVKNSAAATQDTWDAIQMPSHTRRAAVTITSADTTPTIAESQSIILTGTTTVTDFDDGKVGDTIYVMGDNNAGLQFTHNSSGPLILEDAQDTQVADSDCLIFHMFEDQIWQQVSRSNNRKFTAVLTTDEAEVDTTLADISDLSSLSLLPATYYKLSGYFKVNSDSATQDWKFIVQTSQAFQEEHMSYHSVDEDGTTTSDSGPMTTALTVDIAGAKIIGVDLSGMLLTHATAAATVDFQSAQGTDAGTTTVEKGSWISYEPIVPG